ncbi:hypothetical protein PBY51_001558 [Eleginops maclovinus]|uniref:Uncharacterized protein n=1 Tax=Eleginops maclovinus TaxID=56733 RepID=A0AAN8ACX2_ELEMC|nr:hypothetical protein PBY51_001558 [Eleginops maclovinus]
MNQRPGPRTLTLTNHMLSALPGCPYGGTPLGLECCVTPSLLLALFPSSLALSGYTVFHTSNASAARWQKRWLLFASCGDDLDFGKGHPKVKGIQTMTESGNVLQEVKDTQF